MPCPAGFEKFDQNLNEGDLVQNTHVYLCYSYEVCFASIIADGHIDNRVLLQGYTEGVVDVEGIYAFTSFVFR